jgi:hypothetical protein
MCQVVLLTLVTAAGGACRDSQTDVVGAWSSAGPRPLSVESAALTIYGGTYGPQGQFVTPPSCTPVNATVTDTVSWLHPGGGPDSVPITFTHPTHLGIENTTGDDCPVFHDAGGNLYVGGTVYINVTGAGAAGHVEMPAKFTHSAEIVSLSSGQTAEIGVVLLSGFDFVDWLITRADGTRYRSTSQILFVTAENADREYFAELMVHTDPGNPPPDDTTSTCIDPSQPSCQNP